MMNVYPPFLSFSLSPFLHTQTQKNHIVNKCLLVGHHTSIDYFVRTRVSSSSSTTTNERDSIAMFGHRRRHELCCLWFCFLLRPSLVRCQCEENWFGRNCSEINICDYNKTTLCPERFVCRVTGENQECKWHSMISFCVHSGSSLTFRFSKCNIRRQYQQFNCNTNA